MFRSPTGRVLLLHRVDGTGWSIPAGHIEPGESAAAAAVREAFEEVGFRAGHAGQFHTRRIKDGIDFTTFLYDCDEEFTPTLNHEHDAHIWALPAEALAGDEGVGDDQPASPASTSTRSDHGEAQELVKAAGDPPELTETRTHFTRDRDDDVDHLGDDPDDNAADIAAVAVYLESLVTRIDARLTVMERQRQEDMARGS
jgi:NUDIX domain